MSNLAHVESTGNVTSGTGAKHHVHRLYALASLTTGAILGLLIWSMSRPLTGHAEPWDAPGLFYPVALVVAGIIATSINPRSWLYGTLGVYFGQIAYLYLFDNQSGPSILPPLLSVAMFGFLPALAGGLLVFSAFKLWRHIRERIPNSASR